MPGAILMAEAGVLGGKGVGWLLKQLSKKGDPIGTIIGMNVFGSIECHVLFWRIAQNVFNGRARKEGCAICTCQDDGIVAVCKQSSQPLLTLTKCVEKLLLLARLVCLECHGYLTSVPYVFMRLL